MIQLTDYETGEPIYLDPKIIASLRQLPSHVTEIGKGYFEHGRRTVISVLEYGSVNFHCLVTNISSKITAARRLYDKNLMLWR